MSEAKELRKAFAEAKRLLAPPTVYLKKEDNTFGTPPELFAKLYEEFHFTVDAMASKENALLSHYWTEEQDALKQSWANERVFCNPPYARGMVKKTFLYAEEQCRVNGCELAVLLIPTNTERDWFHNRDYRFETRFLKGRVQFVGGATGARGTHMLCIFRNSNWIW